MKKSLFLVFLVVVFISFVNCGPSNPGGQVKGKSFKSGVWMDENTYRMSGIGAPMKNTDETSKLIKDRQATEAAELDAQYRILQKFIGAKVTGASGMKDFRSTGTAVAKEASGMIKGGSIVDTTCDKDSNCEVVYEVSSPGLKKKVTTEFLKGKSMDDVQ